MKNKTLICTLAQRRFIMVGSAYLLTCTSLKAQSASPDVIASAGDHFSGPSGSVSWTIGETVTDTYYGATSILTKGFHQPEVISLTSVPDNDSISFIYAYPNPVISELVLDFTKLPAGKYSLNIYSSSGKQVKKMVFAESILHTETLHLTELSAGLYFVRITNEQSEKSKTFSIIKQ